MEPPPALLSIMTLEQLDFCTYGMNLARYIDSIKGELNRLIRRGPTVTEIVYSLSVHEKYVMDIYETFSTQFAGIIHVSYTRCDPEQEGSEFFEMTFHYRKPLSSAVRGEKIEVGTATTT